MDELESDGYETDEYEPDEYEPMEYELNEPVATQPRQDVKKPHCHQRVEVDPQLNKISPPDLERMLPEGGQSLLSHLPLGQHYVHPGEGRPPPSKKARRNPQQGQRVAVTIEGSPTPPVIAFLEPTSTTSSLDRRIYLLRGGRLPLLHPPREMCPRPGSFCYDLSSPAWETFRRGKSSQYC